jgi:hypothetical protein
MDAGRATGKANKKLLQLRKELIDLYRVKADELFIAGDEQRRYPYFVYFDKLFSRLLVSGDVHVLEVYSSFCQVLFQLVACGACRL